MAATVSTEKKNDTKAIEAALKNVGRDISDIEKGLAAIKKQVAAIQKNPEECKKAADAMCDGMSDVLSVATGWKDVPKTLSKAIQK